MLRIAVAEDEKKSQEQIQQYLRRFEKEQNIEIGLDLFSTGKELTEHYQPVYDILVMDIQMPDMDGMTAAEEIRKRDESVVIVFVTNLAQYAIRGYEVGALDYILKPVNYETFKYKFDRAVARVRSRTGGRVVLNTGGGLRRIRTRDIYFVEIQNHMLHYHTNEEEIVIRGTMAAAEKQLEGCHFAKCNHWYLVNLLHISEVTKNSVIVAGTELEISRRSRASFLQAVAASLGGNI